MSRRGGHYARYYDRLREQCLQAVRVPRGWKDLDEVDPSMTATHQGREVRMTNRQLYSSLLAKLDDPNTKRIVVDSRQVAVFAEMGTDIPDTLRNGKVHLPFEQFYMELTEPLGIEPEPGTAEGDQLRAFLVYPETMGVNIPFTPEGGEEEMRHYQIHSVTAFLFNPEEQMFIERTFSFNIAHGLAFTKIHSVVSGEDPSEIPEGWASKPDNWLVAGQEFTDWPEDTDRYVGWWERTVAATGALVMWMAAYMMAKGIQVRLETPTRQQRRLYARKGSKMPSPWHIVHVEPKFAYKGGGPETETGRHHRYRYDVIGHLRFGRHKRKDGTYSETIEWVSPHQRGLANSTYIPKTYNVSGGKTVAPAMAAHFKGEPLKGAK